MAIGERAVRDAELMDVLAIIRGFSVSKQSLSGIFVLCAGKYTVKIENGGCHEWK